MIQNTTVALDAMGGDHAPGEIIAGAIDAVNEDSTLKVLLVGKAEVISSILSQYDYSKDQIEVVNAAEVIETSEPAVAAIRKKKDSSIVVGMKLVKNQEADAFVSAGSSGAVLVGGQTIVGRIKGVDRAPLAPFIPTARGVSLLIDCGANVDARPAHLLQFARMGSIYVEKALGIKDPRVGIVNIGAEEEKGNSLTKSAFPLLKEDKSINFVGSVEAREIPKGQVDVIVCEAFTGNVILKLYEGLGKVLISKLKQGLMSSLRSRAGAFLIKPALKQVFHDFDGSEYGGAPLLGLNGLVVKTHGNAKRKEVKNTLFQCKTFKDQNISELIRISVQNEV